MRPAQRYKIPMAVDHVKLVKPVTVVVLALGILGEVDPLVTWQYDANREESTCVVVHFAFRMEKKLGNGHCLTHVQLLGNHAFIIYHTIYIL